MSVEYSTKVGSNAPVRFRVAYTGGTASLTYAGDITIATEREDFARLGQVDDEVAFPIIVSDFKQATARILSDHFENDASANPEGFQFDKEELIARVNEHAAKNNYEVIRINDFVVTGITMNTPVAVDTSDIEKEVETSVDATQIAPKPVVKKDISVPAIIAIIFGAILLVGAVVTVVLVVAKKNKK